MTKKIDADGNYLQFRGITLISPLHEEQEGLWNDFVSHLEKVKHIKKYYALLPKESYHVTIINLFSEKDDCGTLLNQIINNYKRISEIGDKINKLFKVTEEVMLQGMFLTKTMHVNVKFDNTLEEFIDLNTEKEFKRIHPFHITLAYKFKDGIENDLDAQNEIAELNKQLNNKQIKIKKPSIATFNDMTKFNL